MKCEEIYLIVLDYLLYIYINILIIFFIILFFRFMNSFSNINFLENYVLFFTKHNFILAKLCVTQIMYFHLIFKLFSKDIKL